ncbi:MAG: TMEM165/GDT1 family protein [Synechococcales cyanobacterium CRU_2_2]|nr:TMEM165/GDT1 family protein [Synechococcales cyanobacterium CRU_2_2]
MLDSTIFLTGFTKSLIAITLFELGDKTFFIGALLATKHPRRWVFAGVIVALAAMTILSVMFGQVAALLPERWVKLAEIILFAAFGFKLLYEAWRLAPQAQNRDELEEAEAAVALAEARLKRTGPLAIMVEAYTLVFVAEWGDRTQFTTIALAADYPGLSVILGGTLGHGVCAALAVVCGRWLCGRISERMLTALGGLLFLVFAAIAGYSLPT